MGRVRPRLRISCSATTALHYIWGFAGFRRTKKLGEPVLGKWRTKILRIATQKVITTQVEKVLYPSYRRVILANLRPLTNG